MAYDKNRIQVKVPAVGSNSPAVFTYEDTVAASAIAVSDYFTDGRAMGMRVNDQLIYTKTSATQGVTTHAITALSSAGAATVSAPLAPGGTTIDNLTDTNLTAPATDDMLVLNGGVWENVPREPWYRVTAAETAAAVTPTDYSYPPLNVLRYGADPTGVADSAAAIQMAIDVAAIAANTSGVVGSEDVVFPYGTYGISSTLDWKQHSNLVGRGGANYSGSGKVPWIEWNGTAGLIMIQTEDVQGWHNYIKGLALKAGTAQPATHIDFRARPDFGTPGPIISLCQFTSTTEPSLIFNKGATNLTIRDSRWDACGSWGIKMTHPGTTSAQCQNMSIKGCTWANGAVTGTSGQGQGLIFFDWASLGGQGNISMCNISETHIEVNVALEEWLPLQGNATSAVIAVGHETGAGNPSSTNLLLNMSNCHIVAGGAVFSNGAVVKMSETTDAISFTGKNIKYGANNGSILLDNTTTPFDRVDSDGFMTVKDFSFGIPQASDGYSSASYHSGKVKFDKLYLPEILTANLAAAAAAMDGVVAIVDTGDTYPHLVVYGEGVRRYASEPHSVTGTELADISHAVNLNAYPGKMAWSTTDSIPLYKANGSANGVWKKYSDNTTAYTPV